MDSSYDCETTGKRGERRKTFELPSSVGNFLEEVEGSSTAGGCRAAFEEAARVVERRAAFEAAVRRGERLVNRELTTSSPPFFPSL